MVLAFYQLPAFAEFAASLGRVKASGGLPFAFLATACAGILLPESFKIATRDERRLPLPELAYMFLVFGINGMIVDLFYRGQGLLFGTEATLGVVAAKVAVDQTVGSLLIFNPYFLFMILLYKSGFSRDRLREGLRKNSFLRQMWPILVVNWAYWIPALFGVYAMPSDLQFVLFLFVEAAWSLILVHVAKREH